jgi:hypothetical protein
MQITVVQAKDAVGTRAAGGRYELARPPGKNSSYPPSSILISPSDMEIILSKSAQVEIIIEALRLLPNNSSYQVAFAGHIFSILAIAGPTTPIHTTPPWLPTASVKECAFTEVQQQPSRAQSRTAVDVTLSNFVAHALRSMFCPIRSASR